MARQELDHGVLSARVFAALGGEPRCALPPLEPVPSHEGCTPLEVVLRNVIAISCCGETLAVAVIGSERERAVQAPLHATLTTILRDEVGHARFGWGLMQQLLPSLGPATKRRLSAYLVAVFERDMLALVAGRHGEQASGEALALGAPDGPLAWSLFLETLLGVTIPGLERYGLQARWAFERAWARVVGPTELAPVGEGLAAAA